MHWGTLLVSALPLDESQIARAAEEMIAEYGDEALTKADGQVKKFKSQGFAFQILYFEDLSVGMVESHSKTVKSSDVVGFAEITGDRNPIHLSEHFAAKTPFKGRIAHGLYTASLISAVIGTRLPGPGAIYVSQTLRFLAPVRIGDTVDAIVEVVDLSEQRQRVGLLCTCKVGNTVVLEGEAIVKVPRRQQD